MGSAKLTIAETSELLYESKEDDEEKDEEDKEQEEEEPCGGVTEWIGGKLERLASGDGNTGDPVVVATEGPSKEPSEEEEEEEEEEEAEDNKPPDGETERIGEETQGNRNDSLY